MPARVQVKAVEQCASVQHERLGLASMPQMLSEEGNIDLYAKRRESDLVVPMRDQRGRREMFPQQEQSLPKRVAGPCSVRFRPQEREHLIAAPKTSSTRQ